MAGPRPTLVTRASEPAAVGEKSACLPDIIHLLFTLERVLLADVVAICSHDLVFLDRGLVSGVLDRERLKCIYGGFGGESTGRGVSYDL